MSETKTASKSNSGARRIVESALMVAFATALSMVKLLDLPYGGSVTIACMLPIVIISYRHGIRWGLLTGAVFGIIQQLLGLKTLSYVTTWQSVLAVIILDYLLAFMVAGLGGLFKKVMKQQRALLIGAIFICVLRYACHVLSGATVWAGLSIPSNAALIYSIGYNATYMIPETLVTAVAAYYIGSVLDFRGDTIRQLKKEDRVSIPILKWIGGFILTGAVVFDIVNIFSHLQNAETGEFDTTGFASVNWLLIAIVTVAAVAVTVLLFIIDSKIKGNKKSKDE